MWFLLNLLGCVHLLLVKCWFCVDAPKQNAILQLQINKNEQSRDDNEPKKKMKWTVFCCSQESFIKGVIFLELELIILDDSFI